jgi:hypothetical protein
LTFGEALISTGRVKQAVNLLASITNKTLSETMAVRVAELRTKALVLDDKSGEAIAVLRNEFTSVTNPTLRARVLRSAAAIYRAQTPPQEVAATDALEAALHYEPDDTTRFDVAYASSALGLNTVAAYHYSELESRRYSPDSVLNNLGVVAAALGLLTLSTHYYRSASAIRSDKGIENLTAAFADAGLADEARAIITKARQDGLGTSGLDIIAGSLGSRELNDKEEFKQAVANGRRLAVSRGRVGESTLTSVTDYTSLSGQYVTNGKLIFEFECHSDGTCNGWFELQLGRVATLSGKFEGACLIFTWNEEAKPSTPSTSLLSQFLQIDSAPRTGQGLIIFDDAVSGYRIDGLTSDIRAAELDARTEFVLRPAHETEQKTLAAARAGSSGVIKMLLGTSSTNP